MNDVELRKLPPQNLEAEMSILGGILIDNDAINRALEYIVAGGFLPRKPPQDLSGHDAPLG